MDNYTLQGNTYQPDANDQEVLRDFPPTVKEDWSQSRYTDYKAKLKRHYYFGQRDRCAYCRNRIEAEAYYEPLDHIVAKSEKPEWLLEPQNLVVTCDRCNNRKSTSAVLSEEYQDVDEYPEESEAFIIFNPHFDQWEDHLQYEDDIFLVAVPDSKGEETISTCRLDLEHIIINRAKHLRLGQKDPLSRVFHRLQNLDQNSETYTRLKDQLNGAFQHFYQRIQDMEGFN